MLCGLQVRFLLPVLPVFNIAAAAALSRIWKNRCKPAWLLPSIVAALLLASTACATAVMLAVSRHNYPGGHAMHELHKWQDEQKGPQKGLFYVHIDVLPAMTGVSRFGEYGPAWRYSKASISLYWLSVVCNVVFLLCREQWCSVLSVFVHTEIVCITHCLLITVRVHVFGAPTFQSAVGNASRHEPFRRSTGRLNLHTPLPYRKKVWQSTLCNSMILLTC